MPIQIIVPEGALTPAARGRSLPQADRTAAAAARPHRQPLHDAERHRRSDRGAEGPHVFRRQARRHRGVRAEGAVLRAADAGAEGRLDRGRHGNHRAGRRRAVSSASTSTPTSTTPWKAPGASAARPSAMRRSDRQSAAADTLQMKRCHNHDRRPGQASVSERDPGPITTNLRMKPTRSPSAPGNTPVVMGPRFREDDSGEIKTSCPARHRPQAAPPCAARPSSASAPPPRRAARR